MDALLEKIWNYAAQNQAPSLQVRIFRLFCLNSSAFCLFLVLPTNLLQTSIPLSINLGVIFLGAFGVFCYRRSLRGRHHIKSFIAVVMLMLSFSWFVNGGISGSVTYYFFATLMMPMVLCQGRIRWIFVVFLGAISTALFLAEYHYPETVMHFSQRSDWFIDNYTGLICSFFAIILVLWVIVTSYDREQKQLARFAKELAASEENYRGVVENAMSIILRMEADGKITFINRFGEQLLGWPRMELIGRNIMETIVPEFSAKGENLKLKLAALLAAPEKFPLAENENLCRDGRRIWITWTNQPIYDESNRLREILCVGADVTERAALLEKLRLTQITMDAAAEQILWTDHHGRILYANAAAIRDLGYTEAELHALTLPDLIVEFSPAAWPQRWTDFKREKFATLELQERFKDGRTRPVELSVSYIRVADKEYTTVFIRDLTGRRQNEERRREHEQQMQHLQRLESLGLLAGGIAHDFNNLLTAILANISLVKMDLRPGTENYEVLAEAEKASFHAKSLTSQLLTFAKGGKPVKAAVQLEQVIRDSTSFALRGKSVRAHIEIQPGLNPVDADAAQLTQVFNNLVLNACQAMPDGGQLTIRAGNRTVTAGEQRLVAPGDYVEVCVQDEGSGIPAEHLDKIFDPYFTTKPSGTGLGLAVVHSIISHHQGSVTVFSPGNSGATFTLLLPVSHQKPVRRPALETPATKQNHRILIMDDEPMVARVLGKILGKFGYEVEMTPDGHAALSAFRQAAAQQRPFDLVIMDLTVPGSMGGKETIRHLQEIDPQVRAIVSSGYSNDPVMAEHQAHGFKGVILKPYTHEQIQSAVRKALES